MKPRRPSLVALATLALLSGLTSALRAGDPPATAHRMELPASIREYYRNPDGSCVQCSLGMCGANQIGSRYTGPTAAAAALLLWDSEYGPQVRGGSNPYRVEDYCDARKIAAYNVTGANTWDWMKWAAKTGRFAAIGAGRAHFQTLYGWDEARNVWFVANNNSPERVDAYTWEQFRNLHLTSGQWVVILDTVPPPVNPRYIRWW